MSKTITLNLKRDLILEAVKADTFITGKIDKAGDLVKNAAIAYNESAGDEQYQERKLIRTLRSALAKFEANLSEFVDSNGSITDTFSSTTEQSPAFTITIIVSDRYNNGLANPLASLAEEYIINMMDFIWWQPINMERAKGYLGYAQDSLTHIRLCLAKTAPASSTSDYTDVNGTVTTDDDNQNENDNNDNNNTD